MKPFATLAFLLFSMSAAAAADDASRALDKASDALEAVEKLDREVMRELRALRQENADLKAALEKLISRNVQDLRADPSRSFTGYTASRGSSAHTADWRLECPSGQVMAGLEMVVSNACGNTCAASGGTLHKYRILCAPRFK